MAERLQAASQARAHYAKTSQVDYIGELLTHQTHYTQEELEKIPAGFIVMELSIIAIRTIILTPKAAIRL